MTQGFRREFVRRNTEGMALVTVLVVLALLTVVITEFAYGIYMRTSALSNWQQLQKLSLEAKSGVMLVSKGIAENARNYTYTPPSLKKEFDGKAYSARDVMVSLRVEDESARFNVNSLVYPNGLLDERAYESFKRLLSALGLDEAIADAVADWIDPDREPRRAATETGAKNHPLDSVDELLLVTGIDESAYKTLAPYVTVYGNGLIDINYAEKPVLMALSDDIDDERADRIVRYREFVPFESPADISKVAGFEKIGATLMGRISAKGSMFRVFVSASDGTLRRTVEAVLEVAGDDTYVQYWKEL